MLSAASEGQFGRAMVRADILKNMAAAAPAFGMIGTLVGLVIMLENLGTNPEAIGPALAIALLTTLYGVLLARLVCLPRASLRNAKASSASATFWFRKGSRCSPSTRAPATSRTR